MKKKYWLVSGALVIVIAGALFFVFGKKNGFELVSPKRGDITEAVYGIGTVQSNQTFQLKIGITSTIQKIFVKEGDFVKKGAPLVAFQELAIQRAPFDGTITSLPYKQGETAFPQTVVLQMSDLSNRYLSVSLEQQGALRVKPLQIVRMSFESLRGQKFAGKVRTIFPSEGQFIVNVDVQGLPNEILTGMTADVAIEVGKKEKALLIPFAGVQAGKVVVEHKNGSHEKLEIQIGSVDGEWVEVLSSNISLDDQILVRGK